MTTPERAEAIKALSQLATMYHMSSPSYGNKADPNALRLRNRAAVLQLSTHANISEEEAAEKYYQQQNIIEQQRRRELELETLRGMTNGGIPNDPYYGGNNGSFVGIGSPNSNSPFRRHYMVSRRLGGGAGGEASFSNGSFASGSPNLLTPTSVSGINSGGFGPNANNNATAAFPPPPVRRDTAIGAVESLITLANSYAATGRFTDAVRVVKRAIAFAENQFKPKEIEGQNNMSPAKRRAAYAAAYNSNKFRKSNTLTSVSSTAPTVSSIHEGNNTNANTNGVPRPGSPSAAGSPSSPRRVGFADDANLNNGSMATNGSFQYGVEALKHQYDSNASFGHDEATNTLTGSGSPFFASVLNNDSDSNAYINQPQLVPLLVLLSTFLDAEGSRHEAQCVRDRIRAITENVQGIGIIDSTNGRTAVADDVEAMEMVLTPVADQFAAREHLLEMSSPDYRRQQAEELLRQRTGGGNSSSAKFSNSTSAVNFSRSNTSGGMSSHSGIVGGTPARSSYSAPRGDASPGSVAYVRGKNYFKY